MYSGCLDLGLSLGSDPSGLRGLPFGHPLGLGGGGGSSGGGFSWCVLFTLFVWEEEEEVDDNC